MISFILLAALCIPFAIKWRASDFLYSEKRYGIFLIWLSRILTSFFIISAAYYWFGEYSYYLGIAFLINFAISIYQERRLYLPRKQKKQYLYSNGLSN